jgi:hypothetical protein
MQPPTPVSNFSWLLSYNPYEAAALNALGIGAKPTTMRKNASDAKDTTQWSLMEASADGRYHTSTLRKDFNGGKPQGILATETLHPYHLALRSMTNRHRLDDAQRGRPHRIVEEAPGSWVLEPGHHTPAELSGLFIETQDHDRALALIGSGSALISISGPEGARTYRLTRLALPSKLIPDQPRADNGIWWLRHQNQTLFPDHASSHFGQQIHALHCYRILRRTQFADRYIIVSHKTPFFKGGAIHEKADSTTLLNAQKNLGIKI